MNDRQYQEMIDSHTAAIRKLERAFDRAHLHECPGNPDEESLTTFCSHTALDHMADRTTAILTKTIFEHMRESLSEPTDLELHASLGMLALNVISSSRLIASVALSCVAAAHEDPEWARRVTEAFRRSLDALVFSGEIPNTTVVDISGEYLRWMRPE